MKANYIFKRTSLIMFGLSLFLLGLIIIRIFSFETSVLFGGIVFIGLLAKFRKLQKAFIVCLLLFAMYLLGIARGYVFVNKLNDYQQIYKQQISFIATAREDAVYSDRKQLVFSASNIELLTPNHKKMIGNIEIEGIGSPMVYKGDKVIVTGKLFSKRGDNVAGMSFAQITIINHGHNKIDSFRRNFAAGLQNVLPEPLASLGLGILIGQRSTLSKELTKQLTQVGLIHIVVVSGYNLTVIIYCSQRLLKKYSRFQALVVSIILIVVFLMVTGSSPSIVRAAVVSLIGLITWYYGRSMKPMLILLVSAVITAGLNPLYIWSSVGWYLSFSAFFGILILAPMIHKRFVPKKMQTRLLPQVIVETLSAQICTIPILLYIFSTLSLVSMVANILVVPLVPFVMLATLVAGLYGMVGPILLGGIIVLPARVMLSYVVETTRLLSQVPYASIKVVISASQTAILCGLIIVLMLLLARSSKTKKLT